MKLINLIFLQLYRIKGRIKYGNEPYNIPIHPFRYFCNEIKRSIRPCQD